MEKSVQGRRSSGLLRNAQPGSGGNAQALCEALGRLSAVTRAITANLRNVNGSLERILIDQADIEDLHRMLISLTSKQE